MLRLPRATHASERGIRMLLDALSSIGVLVKQENRYRLTDAAGAFLSQKSPASLAGLARHMTQIEARWLNLTEAVRTDGPVETRSQQEMGKYFAQLVDPLYALNDVEPVKRVHLGVQGARSDPQPQLGNRLTRTMFAFEAATE